MSDNDAAKQGEEAKSKAIHGGRGKCEERAEIKAIDNGWIITLGNKFGGRLQTFCFSTLEATIEAVEDYFKEDE